MPALLQPADKFWNSQATISMLVLPARSFAGLHSHLQSKRTAPRTPIWDKTSLTASLYTKAIRRSPTWLTRSRNMFWMPSKSLMPSTWTNWLLLSMLHSQTWSPLQSPDSPTSVHPVALPTAPTSTESLSLSLINLTPQSSTAWLLRSSFKQVLNMSHRGGVFLAAPRRISLPI